MKKIYYLIILILLIVSCKPCKVITETIIQTDTIRQTNIITKFRDTIIYKEIKGKTEYIEKPVYIENGLINSEKLIHETELCKSSAQIINSKLISILMQKDTTLIIRLENALREITKIERELIKEKTEKSTILIEKNKKLSWFNKKLRNSGIISIVLIAFLILGIIYKNTLRAKLTDIIDKIR